jgi:hypothetical protein
LDQLLPVGAEIPVAQIIGEDENDIGLGRSAARESGGEERRYGSKESDD